MDHQNQKLKVRSDLIKPLPSQSKFLDAMYKFDYVLFGGAAGPGKSYVLRWSLVELLLYWASEGIKDVRVGLFCEDYPTLKDRHITRMQREFPRWLGELRDSKSEGFAFHLNSEYGGGVIALRNLDDPSKYASSEFAAIGVDELTKNKRQTFDDLRFRKRWPGIEHSPFLASSNPGSIGHGWVKKLWISRDFSGDDENLDPSKFVFIPARAGENPYLPQSYLDTLNSLPPAMRKAMLNGDWDIFAGQAFMEFSKNIHVLAQRPDMEGWLKIICFDWGYTAPGCALWLAISPENALGVQHIYCYRELYQTQKTPEEWAENLATFTEIEDIALMVLPHDCFDNVRGNKTIASIFEKKLKTRIVRGNTQSKGARVNRVAITHQALSNAKDGKPHMFITQNCSNLIRTLPEQVYDEHNVEDIDTSGEDHAYDALSLGLVTLKEKYKLFSGPVKTGVIGSSGLRQNVKGEFVTPNFAEEFKNRPNRKQGLPENK